MTEQSDTPRTDALQNEYAERAIFSLNYGAALELARTLERELSQANATIAERDGTIERMRESLSGLVSALKTDSRDKSVLPDTVEYHLDGQVMYVAINAARSALSPAAAGQGEPR